METSTRDRTPVAKKCIGVKAKHKVSSTQRPSFVMTGSDPNKGNGCALVAAAARRRRHTAAEIEKYKRAIGGGGAAATRWPPVENIRASSWRQNPAATRRSRLQDLSSPKCASPTTGRTDSHNHHKQLTHNHNTSQHPHRHSLRDQHHGKPATPAPPAPVANRDETPSPPAPRRPRRPSPAASLPGVTRVSRHR